MQTFHHYKQEIPVSNEYRGLVEQLVAHRNKLGFSQEELAHNIGCTTSLIHKWEQFKRVPSGFMFSCWVDSLGCKIKITPKESQEQQS